MAREGIKVNYFLLTGAQKIPADDKNETKEKENF